MSAALSSLEIGSLSLTPSFDPGVTEYTATTSNATDRITATANKAQSQLSIHVNDFPINSGSIATWQIGSNTVEVTVTSGIECAEYTVMVTRS